MNDIEKELRALAAHHLALSIIVENVLSKLATEPSIRPAILAGFDEAADVALARAVAVEFAQPAEVLRLIEEKRIMVIDKIKPRHK